MSRRSANPKLPTPRDIRATLSPEGVQGLNMLRRIYGGASVSYAIDRLLRRCAFNLEPMHILVDSNVAGWLRSYAKANGYGSHIEELVADTLSGAMQSAQKPKG